MKVAVMGGTFNPIHLGHLISAETVREKVGLDRVLFIPSRQPPHKRPLDLAPAEHRYAMVQAAVAGNPYFEASRLEIDREGPSYAIDTIRQLRQIVGPAAEICWIIGADMLIEFRIWREYERLLELCHFIATTRPEYDLAQAPSEVVQKVQLVEIPNVAISSTAIRHRIRQGRSIRYLVPESVRDYIYAHGLYGAQVHVQGR